MTMQRVNTDLCAGLVGLLVTGIFWFSREDGWMHSSAVWPEGILKAMMVISVLLLLRAVIKREVFAVFDEGNRWRMFGAAAGLAVWGVGVHYIGFVVTSVIVFPVMAYLISRAEQRESPEVAPALTNRTMLIWGLAILFEIGLLYVVFSEVLLVPLPRGIAF